MASWIDWLSGSKDKSADKAKERLKLVLIHDRTDLSDEALGRMKDEILKVISKYIEIDSAAVNIRVAQDGREQRLMADIPIKAARRKKAT
jgi:cell division topological specificity factor